MQVPKFLKKEGDSLIFNNPEGELIFYIPEDFFTSSYANIIGETINVIGIFDYTITDKSGKNNGLHTFNFPTTFLTKPSSIEKVKNIKLTQYCLEQDYRLLKYKQGDPVVVSTKVPKDIINAEQFYKMFTTGKLPTTIKYDELQYYFMENIRLSGSKYGMNYQVFGILIAEMCRDPKNNTKLFRNTPMVDMTAYTMLGIKEIPRLVSPFTAITSENKDKAIANAILATQDKNHKYSPLERLLTK